MKNCIYMFKSPSGNSYIGKATDFNKRLKSHKKKIKNGTKSKFYDACKKYKIDNFEIIILESNLIDIQMNIKEIYWIKYYDTFNNGYNMTEGGDGLSKGQLRLYNKIEDRFFIGEFGMVDEVNIFHPSKNMVTVKIKIIKPT